MTERLTRASSGRPWLLVGLWLFVTLTAFVLVAMFLAFEGEAEITRTTESKQAERILDEGFPQEAATGEAITEVVVVRAADGQVQKAATRSRVAALADELVGPVLSASSPTARSGASSRRTGTRTSSWWGSVATGRGIWTMSSRRFSASTTSPATGRR